MEFHIEMVNAAPDADTVRDAIRGIDPAALVDTDPSGQSLRIAAAVTAVELLSVIQQAGHLVDPHRVTQIPSVCCGGCGG